VSTVKKTTGRVTPPKSKEVTSASEWKKQAGKPLELPSGKVCLARNPGMKPMLSAGLIPNSLIPIVTEALSRGGSPSGGASKQDEAIEKQLTEQLKTDPKLLVDMMDAIDAVTVYCVIQPKVHPVPMKEKVDELGGVTLIEDPAAKDDDLLYVDEVDFDDKTFIFNWAVGGSRDLERFRS
jgi:hypothetical protein